MTESQLDYSHTRPRQKNKVTMLFIVVIIIIIIIIIIIFITLRKHAYSNILKISPPKNEFSDKCSDIFHISAQTIDCGHSLELARRGGSNEYRHSMFLSRRKKKNNVCPSKPQLYNKKVGFKGAGGGGSKLSRYVFVIIIIVIIIIIIIIMFIIMFIIISLRVLPHIHFKVCMYHCAGLIII